MLKSRKKDQKMMDQPAYRGVLDGREGGSDGLSQKKSRVSPNSAPRTLAPSSPPASGKNPLSSFPDVCWSKRGMCIVN